MAEAIKSFAMERVLTSYSPWCLLAWVPLSALLADSY